MAKKRKTRVVDDDRSEDLERRPAKRPQPTRLAGTIQPNNPSDSPLSTIQRFEDMFPKVLQAMKTICEETNVPLEVWDALEQSMWHNATGGKYNRAISVIDTVSIQLKRDLDDEEFEQVSLLGWMVELFQAFMLVCDDIMDASKLRRGKLCWYKVPDVGLMAINDACLLESVIFLLLKKHFRTHPRYLDFVELFHETAWRTELGQANDMLAAPEQPKRDVDGSRLDLQKYELSRYQSIVKFKTSYYSFYTPMAMALLYLDQATPKTLWHVEEISTALGEYFQVQDDYLDCFGDPTVLGKIGMDIQDNKCSWLICQALLRCDEKQRETLALHYGIKDSQCEREVVKVYEDLELQNLYAEYERATTRRINKAIDAVGHHAGVASEVFRAFLRKIQKRSK